MNVEAHTLQTSDDHVINTVSLAAFEPAAGESHSQRNIREWNTYLPKDCVACMIALRWDVTT